MTRYELGWRFAEILMREIEEKKIETDKESKDGDVSAALGIRGGYRHGMDARTGAFGGRKSARLHDGTTEGMVTE